MPGLKKVESLARGFPVESCFLLSIPSIINRRTVPKDTLGRCFSSGL